MNNEDNKNKAHDNDIRLNIEKADFPGLHHMDITTSHQLAQDLNPLFYNVFRDYDGMTITMDQTTQNVALYANLFFLPGSSSKYATSACVSAAEAINVIDKNANLVERHRAMSRISRNRRNYRSTEQAKRFLAQYICNFKINHVNQPKTLVERVRWNEIETEIEEQMQQGYWVPQQNQAKTYLMIKYISLDKLLAEIYGNKDENGQPIQYQVNVCGQLPSIGMGQDNKLLSVACIDVGRFNKVIEKLGYRSTISNLGIIR